MKPSILIIVLCNEKNKSYLNTTLDSIKKQSYEKYICKIVSEDFIDNEIVYRYDEFAYFMNIDDPHQFIKQILGDSEYLMILNSGDLLCVDGIKFLLENLKPDYGAVFGKTEVFLNQKSMIVPSQFPHPKTFNQLMVAPFSSLSSQIISVEAFNKIGGFDKNFWIPSIWDIDLSICKEYKYDFCDRIISQIYASYYEDLGDPELYQEREKIYQKHFEAAKGDLLKQDKENNENYFNKDKVTIIITTYKRIPSLKNCLDSFSTFSNPELANVLILIDNNDYETYDLLSKCKIPCLLSFYQNEWVKQTNLGVHLCETEYFVFISDDFVAVQKGWLEKGLAAFKARFPDNDGLLIFNDTLSPQNYGIIATHGFSSKTFVRNQPDGVLLHPGYYHYFADTELSFRAWKQKKLLFLPDVILKHDHWLNNPEKKANKDKVYLDSEKYEIIDRELFQKRNPDYKPVRYNFKEKRYE